jgi:nucleoside-diphosphate-sugar epimerase
MGYFVTGTTGFLGSHLVEQLVDRGDEVVALTRDASTATALPADITVVEGDITTKEGCERRWTVSIAYSTSPGGTIWGPARDRKTGRRDSTWA